MALVVKATGSGEFEQTPEGSYIARCFKVIDLGTQTKTGKYGTKSSPNIMIQWELLDDEVKMTDGKPFAAIKSYTASLHEKSQLRKDLEAWRGKKFTAEELEGFNLENILGTYCQIQIVHSEDGNYANINAIMSFKGDKPDGVNDLVLFDISNPDMEIFNSFSDKLQEKIKNTPEWKRSYIADVFDVKDEDLEGEINLDDAPL